MVKKHIPCESPIYAMSAKHKPVVSVRPGERFTADLMDCFNGQIRTEHDLYGPDHWKTVNPATGPILIEGAQKGDILAVKVHDIKLADHGIMIVHPGSGEVGDSIKKVETRVIPIVDGCVLFADKVKAPVNPMIGVIGTAPEGDPIPTGKPGEHGSNMDCKLITAGSTVFLPVYHDGGLLAMGDIHAVMGDGEVCATGVECCGTVELEVSVLKGILLPTPIIETDDVIATIAADANLDIAAHEATRKLLILLEKRFGMERNEAAMWMSAFADLRICQTVNPLKTCRMEAPKSALKPYDDNPKLI